MEGSTLSQSKSATALRRPIAKVRGTLPRRQMHWFGLSYLQPSDTYELCWTSAAHKTPFWIFFSSRRMLPSPFLLACLDYQAISFLDITSQAHRCMNTSRGSYKAEKRLKAANGGNAAAPEGQGSGPSPLLFSTLHPRPIDAWSRIGVAIYAASCSINRHGMAIAKGWKAISRPLGHNIAQARAVRNG